MVGGAIVSPVPGTTRDRRECIGRIGGTTFRLVDTAGVDGERIGHLFDPKGKNPLEQQMMQQTLEAATASDLVLLMIDARVGVTYDLTETARWLRKISNNHDDNHARADNINSQETNKRTRKILLLANKLEGDAWSYDGSPVLQYLSDASRIGYGEAIPISAEHGEGLADIAAVIEELKAKKRERLGLPIQDYRDDEIENTVNDGQEKPLQLAILGRQNVGKSTLVNALLKQQRVLSGATPGLTRDSIAIEWSWQGRPVKLVDTAGIRKATQRDSSNVIEDLAVRDAMRAMKIADVAVLVLDAETRSLQRQELAIADAIIKEGRSIVVVANKMDLLVDNAEGGYTKEEYTQAVRDHLETRLPVLRNTPVVAMCSLTGECVDDLMPLVFHARDRWSRKIPTGTLNRWVADVTQSHAPPMQNGRPARIKYVMQTKGRPPTFLLFCNVAQLPVSYLRYLTRNFQDTFQMFGMEVRIAIKKASASNPFGGDSKKGGRAGRGVGGWKGRQKRLLKELKTHGAPLKHGRKPRRKTE